MTTTATTPALPENPPEQKEMYPVDVALRPAFVERADDLSHVVGMTLDQQQALLHESSAVVRETGLDPYVTGRTLLNHLIDAEVAVKRGAGDEDLPAQIQTWTEEYRREAAATYGAKEAEALLVRVQKFVATHPKLQRVLNTRGIGSRPDVVEQLIEHVRRVNFR